MLEIDLMGQTVKIFTSATNEQCAMNKPPAFAASAISLAAGCFVLIFATEGRAEFALDFQPNPGRLSSSANPDFASSNFFAVLNCNRGGTSSGCTTGSTPSTEKTPFLQEVVSDATGTYYHMIVGDPTQSFAQETYIRLGSVIWPNGQPSSSSSGSAGRSNGGGFEAATTGGAPLASGAISGSGGGNPERTQIRQLLNTPDMTQEFLKSVFLTKPKITQTITTSDIVSFFEADMSAIRYRGTGAATTDASVKNTLTFVGAPVPGNFDLAVNKQNSTVTAGKYSWAPGTGDGLSNGTYTYTSGSFDVNAVDWKAFYNPADNTCWSYKQNPGSAACTP